MSKAEENKQEKKQTTVNQVIVKPPTSFQNFKSFFTGATIDILGILGKIGYKGLMEPFIFLQKTLGDKIVGSKFQPEKGDKPLKVAIIGGGAAGLSAAWSFYNTQGFDFTVFERSKKCGGAADTFQFETEYGNIPCDLGFVYAHYYCYENLLEIMKQVGAEPINAELSISVEFDNKYFWAQTLEQCGDDNKKKYFLSKEGVKECERFQKLCERYVYNPISTWIPIGTFLKWFGFSDEFRTHILYPLLFCLFASTYKEIDQVPARIPFDLFANKNYKFLNFLNSAKQLFTIKHGNQEYVDRLQHLLKDHIRVNSPVTSIKRIEQNGKKQVLIQVDKSDKYEIFDHVLVACSAKATSLMLEDKTHLEQWAFNAVCQTMIPIYLHKDQSFLPPEEFWRPMMYKNTKGHPEFTLIPQLVQYNGINEKLRKINKNDVLMVSMCPHKVPKNVIATKYCPIHLPTMDHIIMMSFVQPIIQGRGNVWFCNSWTSPGGQLGAIDAGVNAAVRLGAISPLKPKLMREQFEIQALCMYGPCFDWQKQVRKSTRNDKKIQETIENFRPRL